MPISYRRPQMNSWVLDHLEKMRAFEAVVRNGSLVKASREVGVSQPALSRLICNLETVSGKKLLERSRLGCRPTPEGAQIVGFYEKLLPMAKDLEQKVQSGQGVTGFLSIGTFESFAITFWPEFLKSFYRERPLMRVALRTADHSRHRERLLLGALHLVVEACPEQHERITSIKVGTDSFAYYVPKRPSREGPLPLVYVPQAKDDNGRLFPELLRDRGVYIGDVYELDTFSAAYEFIASGLAVGVLPERLARTVLGRNAIQRGGEIKAVFGKHSICASFLNENRNDPRISALSRALKNYLAQ